MAREDEIEKTSNKYIEDYLKSSNEYPLCDNRKRMSLIQVDLYKMQEAFENGMKEADKTMLDRACEWMNKVFFQNPFLTKKGIVSGKYDTMEEFITAFRQAMEGGAE